MKKLSKATFALFAIGISPFLIGGLIDAVSLATNTSFLLSTAFSAVFLLVWGVIAYAMEPYIKGVIKTVLLQNAVAIIDLVLIAFQQLDLAADLPVPVGHWTQLFYLPALNLGFTLSTWSHSLFMANLTSFLLMVAASFAGSELRNRKRVGPGPRKHWRSMTGITWLLILSVMGTWLVSMAALTVVTAQGILDELYEKSVDYADNIAECGRLDEFDVTFSLLEHRMFSAIYSHLSMTYQAENVYDPLDPYGLPADRRQEKFLRDISYPTESAALFYDADGKLLHSSEDDILYFNYYTQAEWDSGADTAPGAHYGWIDIGEAKNAENPEDDLYYRIRNLRPGAVLRVTGYFTGTQLVPVVMHYFDERPIYNYPLLSDADRAGKLEWQFQFDYSAEYERGDLVTVYLENMAMWDHQGDPITYRGQKYENLAALTEAQALPLADTGDFSEKSIMQYNELLIFRRWIAWDRSGENAADSGNGIDFVIVTAVRSNPLACAVSALRNIYIVTGILALALVLLVRACVKKYLIQPVADIINGMENDWANVYEPSNIPKMWREAEKLNAGFCAEQDCRRSKDHEITRLNAALRYAKTAEENRRQLTSHIAHELKTPLAVIHSYAEGLKEHIAEDKRDKYIDVILSETERTDGLVLEMLDLSRLEAGRVKLSRDSFSLLALTRGIFEKLEMAAQEKQLQIAFLFPDDFSVTADESRMAQVIENFASNAVKYTPAGGHILVKIQTGHSGTTFSIENDSAPLSDEALRKVWETFYRADEARSGGGTGLGLAIAKNIIELHGGTCAVRNTATGVEFRCTIP